MRRFIDGHIFEDNIFRFKPCIEAIVISHQTTTYLRHSHPPIETGVFIIRGVIVHGWHSCYIFLKVTESRMCFSLLLTYDNRIESSLLPIVTPHFQDGFLAWWGHCWYWFVIRVDLHKLLLCIYLLNYHLYIGEISKSADKPIS